MMVVGVCRVTLMVSGSQSLKDKRAVIRRVKDRVTQKFNVAIAEVGSQDDWQEAVLGFAVVANEKAFVSSVVDKVLAFIEEAAEAKLVDDEKDFVVYGDERLDELSTMSHWEPDEKNPPGVGAAARKGRGRPRINAPKTPPAPYDWEGVFKDKDDGE